jgi:MFS family permease
LSLLFGNTLAASLIWGINTIFLLDAGLSNFEAFAANAFFTVGMVIFEIPTGVVADAWGRRASYILGTLTLALTTLLYYVLWQMEAPFTIWAIVSVFLGLGFTFFSGAVEAWLVDALQYVKYEGGLERVFGRGQIVSGVAMLGGSAFGGIVAERTSLGVPFLLRAAILVVLFVAAWIAMKDVGFEPDRRANVLRSMKHITHESITHGIKNPPVRWMMLSAFFTASVGFYAFYALQPYLLDLYGNTTAYSVAGLAAAIVAAAQIAGGLLAPKLRQLFKHRTSAIMAATLASCITLVGLGITSSFTVALVLVSVWGLLFAAVMPIRQAYLNGMIPSKQRATVLSFDSLIGNSGSIAIQPGLGKVADVYSYGNSFFVGGLLQLLALPFMLLSRRQANVADRAVE